MSGRLIPCHGITRTSGVGHRGPRGRGDRDTRTVVEGRLCGEKPKSITLDLDSGRWCSWDWGWGGVGYGVGCLPGVSIVSWVETCLLTYNRFRPSLRSTPRPEVVRTRWEVLDGCGVRLVLNSSVRCLKYLQGVPWRLSQRDFLLSFLPRLVGSVETPGGVF